jgi:hypothetical protein
LLLAALPDVAQALDVLGLPLPRARSLTAR